MELDYIIIDDKKYIIFEVMEVFNSRYLFLANENDEFDIIIRKVIRKDNGEYIVKLDSKKEFEDLMTAYNEKDVEIKNE